NAVNGREGKVRLFWSAELPQEIVGVCIACTGEALDCNVRAGEKGSDGKDLRCQRALSIYDLPSSD
ncbi:MAG: hypothetical protein ACPIOQ_61840, partial [Promethearchaeia archaeon]